MSESKSVESWVAGATKSLKEQNQDAFAFLRNNAVPLTAMVVADGLGSHYGADAASRIAVRAIAHGLNCLTSDRDIHVDRLFREANDSIKEHAESVCLPADLDRRNAFGTTALCAVETDDQIILAYVGNGAIFHIRGDFNEFPSTQLLPWTALNYLNPHSRSQDGKNPLYKLLSLAAGASEIKPTVLTLNKDQDYCGDIILCCTDGMCSYDQTPIGRDQENKVWIYVDPTILNFFECLNAFFNDNPTEEGLAVCLEEYLQKLLKLNLISDDCTVSVLVTKAAIRYQAARRDAKTKEGEACSRS